MWSSFLTAVWMKQQRYCQLHACLYAQVLQEVSALDYLVWCGRGSQWLLWQVTQRTLQRFWFWIDPRRLLLVLMIQTYVNTPWCIHLNIRVMVCYGVLCCALYGLLWYCVSWYGVVWCTVIWGCMVRWAFVLWYGIVWYGIVWYRMAWDGTV